MDNKDIIEVQAEVVANTAIDSSTNIELVVIDKSIGQLTTNAHIVAEQVKGLLTKYDAATYSGDIATAKADRAMLNKAAKELAAKRLEIEREFAAPLAEFKAVVMAAENDIKAVSKRIDAIVKADDERWASERMAMIVATWEDQEGSQYRNAEQLKYMVAQDKTYMHRTTSDSKVKAKIAEYSASVVAEAKQLMSHPDTDVAHEALALYKAGSSAAYALSQAVQSVERIRAAAKAKIEAEAKAKQEAEERAKAQAAAAVKQQQEAQQPQPQAAVPQQPQQTDAEDVEVLERRFVVRGTREQIIALSDFLNDNNIYFDRI